MWMMTLFELTLKTLATRFDHVVTAGQAHAYKPDLEVFRFALKKLGVPKDRVLHVAQSRFHDIAPANALGIDCVWIDRRHANPGHGATAPSDAVPMATFPDLASLASAVDVA